MMSAFWHESLAATSPAWLAVYADVAAKSVIIFLAAWSLTLFLRKRAAATRHLVWALALGGVLALPVLSTALPAWRVLPGWAFAESEAAKASRLPAETPRQLIQPDGAALDASRAPSPAADGGPTITAAARRDGPADAASQGWTSAWKRSGMTIPAALMLLWVCGMIVSLAPLLAGAIALARLARTTPEVTEGPWALSLEAAMAQSGLRRPVRLFEGRLRSMPAVWGVFAAKLLVPAQGSSWTPERRLVVLLHELAHVTRFDCLTGLAGRVACSIYWPNPLVWFAWRQMRAEGERACDDLVISGGNSAADYADHVLAVVSSVQQSRLVNQAAIAMARPSNLEGRLRAMLDEGRSRRALTRMAVAAAALAVAAVVVPLSMMKASAGEATKQATTGFEPAATAEAPKGTVVNERGQPIPAAEVILYYVNDRWGYGNGTVEKATTGSDGAFAMKKGLAFKSASGTERGDHYLLFAKHPDYAVAWRTVVSGMATGDCRLTMTEAATAEFLVTDGDQKPLAGAKVWLAMFGAPGEQNPFLKDRFWLAEDAGIVTAVTDENGLAKLQNLPRTTCTFFASLDGYGDEWSRPFSPSAPIVPFVMKKAGTVAGRVLTEEGKPVAGAAVWFDPQWGLSWRGYAVTDKDGQFKHDRLAAKGGSWVPGGGSGKYAVSVTGGDYASGTREVELEQGQTVSGFDLVAVKGTLVRVKVLDADDKTAVSGAQVSLIQENTRLRLRGYSDKDGAVEFRLPAAGEATVSVLAPPGNEYLLGSRDDPSTHANAPAKGGVEEVTLFTQGKANKLTTVSGRLVLPDGTPAADIHVTTTNEKFHRTARWIGTGNAHATTGADGSFTLEEVPAGMGLFIYGITGDLRYALAHVMAPSVEPNVLKEPLVMQPTVSCDVVMDDDAGNPQVDTALKIKPSMWGNQLIRAEDRNVTTDADGRLKADGIVPGLEYFVRDARANMSQRNWYKLFNKTMVLAGEPGPAAPAGVPSVTTGNVDSGGGAPGLKKGD